MGGINEHVHAYPNCESECDKGLKRNIGKIPPEFGGSRDFLWVVGSEKPSWKRLLLRSTLMGEWNFC